MSAPCLTALLALSATTSPSLEAAARLERTLGALGALEDDQRSVGAILAVGGGAGAAAAGIVLAVDPAVPDDDRLGPILIGVGAASGVAGLLIALSTGDARTLADQYAGWLETETPERAVARAIEGLRALREDYRSTRTLASILLMSVGVAGAGVGAALASEGADLAVRSSGALSIGAAASVLGVGAYLLFAGETPIERMIDGVLEP